MGTGNSNYVREWTDAAAAFNDRGDLEPLLDMLDDKVVWLGVGESKTAAAEALEQAKQAGWVRHDTTSAAVEGPFLAVTARNTNQDGTTSSVAGVAAFNDAGKITHLASLDTNAL